MFIALFIAIPVLASLESAGSEITASKPKIDKVKIVNIAKYRVKIRAKLRKNSIRPNKLQIQLRKKKIDDSWSEWNWKYKNLEVQN